MGAIFQSLGRTVAAGVVLLVIIVALLATVPRGGWIGLRAVVRRRIAPGKARA